MSLNFNYVTFFVIREMDFPLKYLSQDCVTLFKTIRLQFNKSKINVFKNC